MAKTEVDVGQINASGTPSSTTFLRGDATWNTPAGGSGSTTPTANTGAEWDANVNLSSNNFFGEVTSTATSGSTYTMSITSTPVQVFTGTSTAQLVTLPTTSVPAGGQWLVINQCTTAAVTVQSSGANTVVIVAAGTSAVFTAAVATPTTAANWDCQYGGIAVASGKVLNVSNSLTLAGTDATIMTFPTTSGTVFTTVGGIPAANLPDGIANANSATQSQLVVAGTKYYITNSQLQLPATPLAGMSIPSGSGGTVVAGTTFRWRIALAKSGAGTGTFFVYIFRGIHGTTADTADVSQSIATGTATALIDTFTATVEATVLTTGATGSYFWKMVIENRTGTSTTGFGIAAVPLVFTGTVSSVAMNTASLVFGLGFSNTTGVPTITVPLVQAQAFNMD